MILKNKVSTYSSILVSELQDEFDARNVNKKLIKSEFKKLGDLYFEALLEGNDKLNVDLSKLIISLEKILKNMDLNDSSLNEFIMRFISKHFTYYLYPFLKEGGMLSSIENINSHDFRSHVYIDSPVSYKSKNAVFKLVRNQFFLGKGGVFFVDKKDAYHILEMVSDDAKSNGYIDRVELVDFSSSVEFSGIKRDNKINFKVTQSNLKSLIVDFFAISDVSKFHCIIDLICDHLKNENSDINLNSIMDSLEYDMFKKIIYRESSNSELPIMDLELYNDLKSNYHSDEHYNIKIESDLYDLREVIQGVSKVSVNEGSFIDKIVSDKIIYIVVMPGNDYSKYIASCLKLSIFPKLGRTINGNNEEELNFISEFTNGFIPVIFMTKEIYKNFNPVVSAQLRALGCSVFHYSEILDSLDYQQKLSYKANTNNRVYVYQYSNSDILSYLVIYNKSYIEGSKGIYIPEDFYKKRLNVNSDFAFFVNNNVGLQFEI